MFVRKFTLKKYVSVGPVSSKVFQAWYSPFFFFFLEKVEKFLESKEY